MTAEVVVLVTIGSREDGERLAEALVGERLAACVNLVAPIRSIYRWQGEVCRDDEVLLLVKSTRERYPDLERRIRELHPYDVPEVIALPIAAGSDPYLSWLRAQVD
jgi:periplasmic divalent cation tolerance protein